MFHIYLKKGKFSTNLLACVPIGQIIYDCLQISYSQHTLLDLLKLLYTFLQLWERNSVSIYARTFVTIQ